jgi:triacylglycerol lipase
MNNFFKKMTSAKHVILAISFSVIFLFPTVDVAAKDIDQPHSAIGPRQNDAPIILLHGFSGWGRDEALGFNYWGGIVDVQEHLKQHDYQVFTTASGPFSSSWDRACEIFAQIKGGVVDYGKAHSDNHGHARFGKSFEGFYPEWGTVNSETKKLNKVHLIAHSQGGLDSRILVQLLNKGYLEEQHTMADNVENLSPLFRGNNDWIHSVTTLSTPHDGTTLASSVFRILPNHQQVTTYISSMWSALGLPAYDWKLSQWGLERGEEEAYDDFQLRVEDSAFWRTSRDNASWYLSPEGAREMNGWVHAQPNVFYFSYGSQQTSEGWFSNDHEPDIGMFAIFRPFAKWMGEYTQDSPNRVIIDETWFPNDGIVNTISMNGPKNNSQDRIVEYNAEPVRGVWNDMGVLQGWDHFDYLGQFNSSYSDPRPFFVKLAHYVGALPE